MQEFKQLILNFFCVMACPGLGRGEAHSFGIIKPRSFFVRKELMASDPSWRTGEKQTNGVIGMCKASHAVGRMGKLTEHHMFWSCVVPVPYSRRNSGDAELPGPP